MENLNTVIAQKSDVIRSHLTQERSERSAAEQNLTAYLQSPQYNGAALSGAIDQVVARRANLENIIEVRRRRCELLTTALDQRATEEKKLAASELRASLLTRAGHVPALLHEIDELFGKAADRLLTLSKLQTDTLTFCRRVHEGDLRGMAAPVDLPSLPRVRNERGFTQSILEAPYLPRCRPPQGDEHFNHWPPAQYRG